MKTGNLHCIGAKRCGWNFGPVTLTFYECVDCKTRYPVLNGAVKCNGQIIDKCPWCRPDSQPGQFGRCI